MERPSIPRCQRKACTGRACSSDFPQTRKGFYTPGPMDRRHLRWMIPAAGAVLAVVVSIVLVMQDSGNAACAAPPAAPLPVRDPVVGTVGGASAPSYSTTRNAMCNLGAPSSAGYV